MKARVTQLEAFRRWRLNEETTVQDFLAYIQAPASHRMNVGTAFHEMLEAVSKAAALGGTPGKDNGVVLTGIANYTGRGITFNFECDAEIYLPQFAEVRAEKQYGPLLVSGKLDAIHGNIITDYKTTRHFDALSYLEGVQWKFYLDLYDADEFVWNVFVLKPANEEETAFDVVDFHPLKASRYPAMRDDCLTLANDYYETLKGAA